MNTLTQWKYHSTIGTLYLVGSDQGLTGLYWEEQPIAYAKKREGIFEVASIQLGEYFHGKLKYFDLPLDPIGTPFQMNVWSQLKKIPYGKTKSYKEIARLMKNEKAFRAVGTANGKNPLCIIIPCHRVIASDGSLAGFSGGLERKQFLLELEKNNLQR